MTRHTISGIPAMVMRKTPHPLQPWADRKGGRMELARRAGVTWQVIDEIIDGRRTPRADLAKRISAATDGQVSAARLMGLDDGEHASTVAPTPDEVSR